MLIYGSRATTIADFDVPLAECAHCGQRGTQRMAVFGRYAHVFWIPLFPIGKVAVAECMHCKRTLKKKEFSPELRRKYEEQKGASKRPIWHWAGLGVIGLLFATSILTAALRTPDPREPLLDADVAELTTTPALATDSVAYYLKSYFDEYVVEEMEPENFSYRTVETDDKVLFLLQMPKLKDLDQEVRPELLDMVDELADEFPHLEGKQRYVGVKGRSTFMMVRAPGGVNVNRSVAAESGLYGFYGEGGD